MPPSMSGNEELVTWMFSTAMKAPRSAPPTAIHVFSETASSSASGFVGMSLAMASRAFAARIDGRLDRYARTQPADQRIARVDHDLDGNALHDLREISGRVVGGQQRKLLPARGCDAVDM